jgi:hypothetical protein
MRITEKKTNKQALQAAINSAGRVLATQTQGNVFVSGNLPNITLRCHDSSKSHARSAPSGRKTCSANWLAHKIFLDVLFSLRPNCHVRTSLATYKNAADYVKTHLATSSKEIRHCGNVTTFGAL